MLESISWLAMVLLAASYWFQVWKIHVHKEVRDLSVLYHILLFVGSGILGFAAHQEDSLLFLIKQLTTCIPVGVMLIQIYIHRKDHWHDDKDTFCIKCNNELEGDWKFCPNCGTDRN